MNTLAANNVTSIAEETAAFRCGTYSQINTSYEAEHQLHWCRMNPAHQPCFNLTLLQELNSLHQALKQSARPRGEQPVRFQALASNIDGVYSLGGDLALFKELILAQNKTTLKQYAEQCIRAIHHSVTLHSFDITQISLIQGDALGGGFEGALSGDVIIAERSAKMGLPEVLFNLFPGMGAYNLLSRRVGPTEAEKLILSGRLYSAEQMYQLGVVDILVNDGCGEIALYEYIQKENRARNALQAVRKVRDRCYPITWEELKDIVDIWVDAALKLSPRDLRMMDRLVKRQKSAAYATG